MRLCELELLRKPSPLGIDRGEFERGWAVDVDVPIPAFPQAIPHPTVTFSYTLGRTSGCCLSLVPSRRLGGAYSLVRAVPRLKAFAL